MFRAQACSLALLTEDASELVYTTAAGAGATSVTGLRFAPDRGVLGVLTVLDRDASRPGADDDLLLLQVFCEQAAIALEGARAFRGLVALLLAKHPHLTRTT